MSVLNKKLFCFNPTTIGLIVILFGAIIYFSMKKCLKEGYRDPIYMNRYKMYRDWYPRANGSIYGPCAHLFSGYAYYDTAY